MVLMVMSIVCTCTVHKDYSFIYCQAFGLVMLQLCCAQPACGRFTHICKCWLRFFEVSTDKSCMGKVGKNIFKGVNLDG